MNTTKVYSILVGLLVVQALGCLGDDGQWEEDRKALKALLKSKTKCSAQFFEQFEELTSDGRGQYNSREELEHDEKKKELFAECIKSFEQEFRSRVAKLSSSQLKLVSLDKSIKRALNDRVACERMELRGGFDLIYGFIEFMGEQGAFAEGKKLSLEEFNAKYDAIVRRPCASLVNQLEPIAGIFRFERYLLGAGVQESLFELASASSTCRGLMERRSDMPDDYKAYWILLEEKQLPGDPESRAAKLDHRKRLEAVLATDDRCDSEFFSDLGSVIREARRYMRASEMTSLLGKQRKWLGECRSKFEADLKLAISRLEPDEAVRIAALGGAVYVDGKSIGSALDDSVKVGEAIMKFIKGQVASIKKKKLSQHDFDDIYKREIVELCNSVNAKLKPAVEIFLKYLASGEVTEYNTDKFLIDWIARAALCQQVQSFKSRTYGAYTRSMTKLAARVGRFLHGNH